MNHVALSLWPRLLVPLSVIGFILIGCVFIPELGIHNDEALFSVGVYRPRDTLYSVDLYGERIPLMIMTYLGALKSWLYWPLLKLFTVSPWSVRVPMLVLCAGTVSLSFVLGARSHSNRAGMIACLLLSTDSVFLLTGCFDWGPVALQHAFLVSALVLLSKLSPGGFRTLALAFFLFGLALWNKAIFGWILAAILVAAASAFANDIARLTSARSAAVAGASFLIGCLPLLIYNATHHFATLGSNASFSIAHLLDWKIPVFWDTLDGSALFGYLVASDSYTTSLAPRFATGSPALSLFISDTFHQPHRSLTGFAFVTAALLIPYLWSSLHFRRITLFVLIVLILSWGQMALEGGGGSSHHVVLLWPFPHFLIALVFAEISLRRRVGTIAISVVTAILVISNLLVMNQYYAQVVRFGSGQLWTDAIYPLADFLRDNRFETVVVTDWGISSGLLLLSGGKIAQREIASILKESQLSDTERSQLYDLISDDKAVFVSHTSDQECFKGVNSALDRLVQASGYARVILQTIRDRTGRGMFEVCRFRLT